MLCRICHKEVDNEPLGAYRANTHKECYDKELEKISNNRYKQWMKDREEQSKREDREVIEKI